LQHDKPNVVTLANYDNGNFGVDFEFVAGLYKFFTPLSRSPQDHGIDGTYFSEEAILAKGRQH
jgi:hypothetical protein